MAPVSAAAKSWLGGCWLSFSGEIAYNIFDFRVSAAQFALTSLVDDMLVERFDDLLSAINGSMPADAEVLALKALRVIVESALLRQQAIEEQALAPDKPPLRDPQTRSFAKR